MADFEPKTWTAGATAENVIHAADCYRWQAGIAEAGGRWDGEWEDDDTTGLGNITADQLSALETEIHKLASTFEIKAVSDGVIPGIDEWNRIEQAIDTLVNPPQAFAVYSADDTSLSFYYASDIPAEGDQYKGKTATAVYTDFIDDYYSSAGDRPWNSYMNNITIVTIDSSFKGCKPTSLSYWFGMCRNIAEFNGLDNIDTSKVVYMNNLFTYTGLTDTSELAGWDTSSVTDMAYMFQSCSGLTTLDVSNFNTSSVTDMAYMFQSCSGLTTLDVSNFDTSKVTDMTNMFYGCSGLTTIYSDDSNFVTTKVTSGGSMFTNCSKLVGGNGTAYDSSAVTYTMAHVDTADNPGYFTQR